MRRGLEAIPYALAIGFATIAIAAAADPPAATFDGAYSGDMTLGPAGLSRDYTNPPCVESRTASMTVKGGWVYISYADYKRHVLHYRGRIDAAGKVSAYHKNGDGSSSVLSGSVSGNQFTGDMRRGRCDYNVTLTKG